MGTRGQTGPSLPTRGSRAAAGPPHPPPSDEDVAKGRVASGSPMAGDGGAARSFLCLFFFFPFSSPPRLAFGSGAGEGWRAAAAPRRPGPVPGRVMAEGLRSAAGTSPCRARCQFPCELAPQAAPEAAAQRLGMDCERERGGKKKKKKKNGHMPSLERRSCQNASRQRGAETRRRGEEGLKPVPARVAVHGGRAERRRHRVAGAGQVADGEAGEEKGICLHFKDCSVHA